VTVRRDGGATGGTGPGVAWSSQRELEREGERERESILLSMLTAAHMESDVPIAKSSKYSSIFNFYIQLLSSCWPHAILVHSVLDVTEAWSGTILRNGCYVRVLNFFLPYQYATLYISLNNTFKLVFQNSNNRSKICLSDRGSRPGPARPGPVSCELLPRRLRRWRCTC
jgi:hypothetical protein